jgi:outer membrane protein
MMNMKLLLSVLLASSVLGFSAESPKIATIDLRKTFDNYWRTKQADANLKDQASDLEKERKTMLDQYRKSEEGYKKLIDGMNDAALSTEERDKRKKSAEGELLALRGQEDRIRQFDNTSKTTLGEKQRRVRDQILAEIKDNIKAKAKAGGYTMVIDTAAESINNTPFILYSSETGNDLTDIVLRELNINAPKEPASPKGDTDIKVPKGK